MVAPGGATTPPRQTVTSRRWHRDGTWARILTALQAAADTAGRIAGDVSVDSTVARAHQHAAGASRRGSTGLTAAWVRVEPAITLWDGRGWADHDAASGV